MIGNIGEHDGTARVGASRSIEKKSAQLRIGETATTGIFYFLQGLVHLRFLLIEQSGGGLIEQIPIVNRLFVFGFRSQTRKGGACCRVFTVDYLQASIIKLAVDIEGGSCAGRRCSFR